MSALPYLTDDEIRAMAKPLTQPAAIARWLEREGFTVKAKPNGMPLIARAHFEAVLSGQTSQAPASNDSGPNSGPNVVAFLQKFSRGTSGGQKTKKQSARTA